MREVTINEWVYEQAVIDLIQPGQAVRVNLHSPTPKTAKWHILTIVDNDQVVYKYYSPKRDWIYKVEWLAHFQTLWNEGRIESA